MLELRPRSIGEILDAALQVCRSRYGTLMKIVAVIVVPLQLFSALVQISTVPGSGTSSAKGWGAFAASIGSSILSGLAAQLASAACLKPVAMAYVDDRVDWQESLEFAWSRFRDLLGVIVVVYFFSICALTLLVIPGIYLWISWLVTLPIVLLEGGRPLAVMRRSAELVRGRWWHTFGTYLVAMIILGIITSLLGALLLGVTGASHADYAGRVLLSAAVGSVTGIITMPFLAAVIVLIYFDLRVRKEGFSLRELATLLGRGLPGRSEPPWPGVG